MQKLENATRRSIKYIASFLRLEDPGNREEDESRERWRLEQEDIDYRRYVKFIRILNLRNYCKRFVSFSLVRDFMY